MFPIFNTAIAPNVNAITAANPVHFDVLHYFYYTNDQQLTAPMPTVLLSGLQTDKANYAPGETVTVFFKLSAGSLALSNVALGGVAVLDFLGDSSGFQEGSSFNDAFGGWNFHAVPGTITANSIYSGSFTYIVPANLPEGVYTIYIGSVEANGKSYPGDYTRLVIGAQSLPPAPSAN